ncbi:MAG TPA: SDR family oxidoreductase [Streptosporangiaceae bacterium]|jgi:NAD(P)-dependent dehydrogenase (short-subunit alcohol dehydrogenase family)|nr:SDR family oxidoreductase [Streptosporangiaceae bacterium]
MSDVAGRTFLVTGGNTGIGLATCSALAQRGGRVYVAARSRAKGQAAVARISAATGNQSVFFLPLDLADLDSVRACAADFLARGEPLHGLVNNAGVAGRRGLTRQGFELMFGVNHLGHFALTDALLGCLAGSAPARVVNVSSDAHYSAPGIDFEAVRRPARGITGLREYAVSKLANVLHAEELARRTAGTGITTYALHPGVVASDMWRRVPWPVRPLITRRMLPPAQGAATSLYCATAAEVAGDTGLFYDRCAPRAASPVATPELGQLLWDRSLSWVGNPAKQS